MGDDESADYDDKRLCHACKHVCFFSCVACECSQSKVSCLRHSHFMCRCPTERRYLMIWSTVEELEASLHKVQQFAEQLDTKSEADESYAIKKHISTAPGSLRDRENYQGYEVSMDQFSPLLSLPVTGSPPLELFRHKEGMPTTIVSENSIESHGGPKRMKMTHESLPRIVSNP